MAIERIPKRRVRTLLQIEFFDILINCLVKYVAKSNVTHQTKTKTTNI